MNNAALAVIEEALWGARRGVELEADVYAKREAPAVLSRVLAALGGEPPVAWKWKAANGADIFTEFKPDGVKRSATPLYAHPTPPIDLAAIRAVAEELRNNAVIDECKSDETLRRWGWADRLLRAIDNAPPAAAIPAEIAPDDAPPHWRDTTYAACAYAAGYNAALRKIKEDGK